MKRNIRSAALSLLLSVALLLSLAPVGRAAEEGIGVNLDVCALENDSGTFAVGQKFTWILRGGIPRGLKDARSYVLTFRPDPRLTLETGSTMVILHAADGRQRTLRPGEHYKMEEGKYLRLALTPAGMTYIGSLPGKGNFTPELRISFRASINRTAAMGAAIPGEGSLRCCRADGSVLEADSDRPEVHTGGIRLQLTDGGREPLKNASFRLARLATAADSRARKEDLYIGGKKQQVVFASFYGTADMAGEPVMVMTTDAEGRALAYGLPYGSYYLVQLTAPDGFHPISDPVPVAVNGASHLTRADGWKDREGQTVDNTIFLANTALPETVGRGAVLMTMLTFTALGVALLNARKVPVTEKQA